jgi:hypothetical protein
MISHLGKWRRLALAAALGLSCFTFSISGQDKAGRVGERASTEMPAHSPLVEPDMRISRHPALLKTLA